MKTKLFFIFIFIVIFVWGLAIGVYRIFPYDQIKLAKKYIIYLSEYVNLTSNPRDLGAYNVLESEGLESEGLELEGLELEGSLYSIPCIKNSETSFTFGDYIIELQSEKAPFLQRDGAGALYFNKELFLVGGWLPNPKAFRLHTSNDVWKSSDDGVTWQLLKANSFISENHPENDWKGRHSAGYVVHNGEIFIVGGDANQGYHIDDVWKSTDGVNWELVDKNPPWAPRALHLSFSYNGYIYVIGGQTMPLFVDDNNLDEVYYRDIWRSTDGKNWEKVIVEGELFTPRGGSSVIVLNNEVYIVGGFTYNQLVNNSRDVWTDVWKSSGNLDRWEKVGKTPVNEAGNGFMYHDVASFDNKLWVIGGARLKKIIPDTNEIWLSSDGLNWGLVSCSPLKKSHARTVFNTNNSIVITGGMSRKVWQIRRIKD